ncbi:MAG: SDR family oxidoreductase [Halioglobus sp.]
MTRRLLSFFLFTLLLAGTGATAAEAARETVLITGANRGIGLELARQFTARGYEVIGTARKPEAARELRELKVRVEPLDVADSASVKALAKALAGVPIDVLINNAGMSGHNAATFEETDFDQLAMTFEVNSFGPMRVTQALLPNLALGEGKTVAQMSSVMGSIAGNQGGYYGYRASKTALNQLNMSLSKELGGRGYTCVVLHPGWVQTRMGGESAPVATEDSVAGLIAVIEGLDRDDNGRFIDYQGKEIAS